MKIICYKSDNVTATLKTVRNCTLLCTAYGVDVRITTIISAARKICSIG